ncbi:antitoxin (plasmid) [Xylella taiwanensis]|uniref:Antitoxin n=1 Tax=Xylella taiwanensis TaxID=1444770 RepID=A0ABS8TYC7_9GAMM|nr:antitoxin [Xylella taiwanensis]MCD8459803.1 antitoxin [Xylella taiwanensis]MCD8474193.1 antitoxin [Xylella taiwanensis]UFN08032.1 antitoxin [Xylella taiwanensis]UFN10325.1 antitoxin [Xylella taiwanensis]UFN12613.1 antitoxin [Xylella taiwanensis]
MLDLGINSGSISYEVALEVLGQRRQPFMQAIYEEKQKPVPSQAFIRYCENRLAALDELQETLQPTDLTTIERIITKGESDIAFKVQ